MNKIDVLGRLTPQMAAVLEQQNALVVDAFATEAGFTEMRRNYVREREFWNRGGPVMYRTVDACVPGPHGDIAVRFHHPSAEAPLPGIVYIHGGGFVVGGLDTHDRIMRLLADATGAVVIGVDYRLSPEARFPSAVQECAALAQYLHTQGSLHGVDPDRLAFAGDSGGANLSLSSYLYLRDEVGDAGYIQSLLLYYGSYGLRDSMSRRLLGGAWDGLTEEDLEYYLSCYTSTPEDRESPYFNSFNADLSHDVPPCYIAAAGLDPLKDDSLTLAAILAENDLPVEMEVFEGVLHAFLHHTLMLDEANSALNNGAAFYRRHLKPARADSGPTFDKEG